jgi:hypothetical protein
MVLGIGRGHSFRLGAMVLEHNDRLVQVGVTSSEASGTYVLGLDEAGEWLMMIADNEGVDHPVLSQMAMSRSLQGLAFVDEWCISVRKKKMSQLLLVHEMAHLVCANGGHGREFRTQVVTFVRRYVSLAHAVRLHEMYVAAGLSVEPFAATA